MTEVPKKKVTRTNLNKALKLYEYIKPFKVEYLWGTFFLVVSSVASLAFPKLMGNMINTRITSYNVCYTKLLRLKKEFVGPPAKSQH